MTPRERVIAAIENRNSDTVPYQIDLTTGFTQKLMESTGCRDPEAYLGNHLSLPIHR